MNLRPMTMEDADKMLEWKNYEETRKFAIKFPYKYIRPEDHIKFLEKNLQYFQIIQVEGEVVGAVRVQDNEISIWIDRQFRGYGFSTEAIKMVSTNGMIARIVDGNIASMRSFIKCGYVPVEYIKGEWNHITGRTNYYIFKCLI